MNENEKIKESMKSLVGVKMTTVEAVVKSVDEATASCIVTLQGGVDKKNIRLRSIIDGVKTGLIPVPKVGSIILLGRIANSNEFVILKFAELTKFLVYLNDDLQFSIDGENDEIVFNGNRLNSFIADINALKTQYNKIEQDINNLKTAFSSWITVPTDGGAALKTIAATWYGSPLIQTTVDDIKDEKIKN